jgi:hypothetical protein
MDHPGFHIDVFDSQCHAFRNAQARAVEDMGHESRDSLHPSQDRRHFMRGQDYWQAFASLDTFQSTQMADLNLEHIPIQEEQCIESL